MSTSLGHYLFSYTTGIFVVYIFSEVLISNLSLFRRGFRTPLLQGVISNKNNSEQINYRYETENLHEWT